MQVYIIICKGCDEMITLDIIITFARQLMDFIQDTSRFFAKLFSDIHTFLNRFMSDEVLLMFGILITAFVAIQIFRAVINKR